MSLSCVKLSLMLCGMNKPSPRHSDPPSKRPPAPRLPPELLYQIILHLIPKSYIPCPLDLVAFSLVCRDWYHAAHCRLSDSPFDDLTLTLSYPLRSLRRISSLLTTSQRLQTPYTSSITSLSVHLTFFVPRNSHSQNCRTAAAEVLRILSLPQNLHSLILYLSNPTRPCHTRELVRFLHNLRPLVTKLSTLDFRTSYPIGALESTYVNLLDAFVPNVHTLHLDNVFRHASVHECLPLPDTPRHFSCDSRLDSSLRVDLPFAPLPDPVHCSVQGLWCPTDFSFVLPTDEPGRDHRLRPKKDVDRDAPVIAIQHRRIRCRRLRTLDIRGRFLHDTFLIELAGKARELERLALRPFFPRGSNIEEERRRWEGVRWPSMRMLDIGACEGVDPAFLAMVVKACVDLKEVLVGGKDSEDCARVLGPLGFVKGEGEGEAVKWRR